MNAATRAFVWMTPVCAVLAGLLLVGVLVDAGQSDRAGAPVTNPVVVRPGNPLGTPVYSVTFASQPSGWDLSSDSDASTTFDSTGLRVTVHGDWTYTWASPYENDVDRLSQSVTGTLPAATPFDAGIGVVCVRSWGEPDEIDYDFLVQRDGGWIVTRTDGTGYSSSSPHTLSQGALVQHTSGPLRVTAVCASSSDHRTVRLQLSINGVAATTATDSVPPNVAGFAGGIATGGSETSPGVDSVFEIARYDESDLGN